MEHKLILKDIFSYNIDIPLKKWHPINEDVNISLSINIGYSKEEGVMYFYSQLFTPEALLLKIKDKNISEMLVTNRILVISSFDFDVLKETINNILDKCTRDTSGESFLALERYFEWEYEDWGLLSKLSI